MNIRKVGQKIKSVTNVKKITKAMQLVSAVKMKKAQQAALEGKPYQELLEAALRRVSRTADLESSQLLRVISNADRKLVILISSNKGLCGAFNFNLLRFLLKSVDVKKCDFVTIGKKGSLLVRQLGGNLLADFSSNAPLESVSAVFQFTLDEYLKKRHSSVSLVYNKFISSLRYDPVEETVLPLTLEYDAEEEREDQYLIEPDPATIMDALIKNYTEEKIRFSIIQSEAGEHSARMLAMQNATDNALNVIYNLTLLRNKLRQQKITYELLDMITAKESVEA